MKILMLAAFALAAPAMAQETAMPAPAPTMPEPAPTEAAPADPAAPTAQAGTGTMPSGETPVGGYGPTVTNTPVTPGATVRFQAAPSPDQAYPAPAPMDKYPVCKKGQYDNCVERNSPK